MSGVWSDEDAARFREMRATYSVAEIAAALGRSVKAVQKYYEKTRADDDPPLHTTSWTAARIATLREMWGEHKRADVAAAIGLSVSMCQKKAYALGLSGMHAEARRKIHRAALAAARSAIGQGKPATANARTPANTIARRCLCCSRAFKAPTRFIRLCDECRTKDTGMIA